MIYKRYELSLSQNGSDLIYIARNALGNVVFREPSKKALMQAIDNAEDENLRQIALEEKRKEEAEKKKSEKKKRGLFQSEELEEEMVVEEKMKAGEESILVPTTPPHTNVTRGPDGKFISRGQLEVEEPKKKNLWEKIIS